jgi:hypothetical protein
MYRKKASDAEKKGYCTENMYSPQTVCVTVPETCRFDTRVDYCFVTASLTRAWRAERSEHIVAMPYASDHNLMIARFILRD